VNKSRVAGKDNNQLSSSGRNSGGDCDSDGDDGNETMAAVLKMMTAAVAVTAAGGIENGGDSISPGAQTTDNNCLSLPLPAMVVASSAKQRQQH